MSYLESAIKQFEYYKHLGDKSILGLDDSQLLWKQDGTSNSIAIIINHMHGNMMSRWTDFMTTDGEKDFRKRDQEFEEIIKNKKEALKKWEEGWSVLFNALSNISPEDCEDIVYIRNIGHTVTEAINRQLCHYAYHVGQIVFISKMLQAENWKSLSIPKGESKRYNAEKFAKEKHKGHFTDEFLKE